MLIIMTGGTICMKPSPEGAGLVPVRGFLNQGMAPRPSFNDGSMPGEIPFLRHRSERDGVIFRRGETTTGMLFEKSGRIMSFAPSLKYSRIILVIVPTVSDNIFNCSNCFVSSFRFS